MIEERGLGGRNVMSELRIMEFIKKAFPLIGFDDTQHSNPDYGDLFVIQAAVRDGAVGANFEYGDIYVTADYDKAASYAQRAPETAGLAKTLIEIGRRLGVNAVDDTLSSFPDAKAFLGLPYAPIVLKLPKITFDRIENERGVPLNPSDNLYPAYKEGTQHSFRVKGVVPFNDLEVIEVEKATTSDVTQ